jgi:2-polyprenyl-6-hydroxyphenyl methylase/3-demethylubiquinone-9 3-methyltransferase
MERLERLVPPEGRILDLGCGHGLFSNLLALRSPRRRVLGLDPAPNKIEAARQAAEGLPNVEYQVGYLQDLPAEGFDVITVVDVLYLLPPQEKKAVLQGSFQRLRPGGLLLLKTNDTTPWWKFRVTQAQETLMTSLGLTKSQGQLYFFSSAQHTRLLQTVGFSVSRIDLTSRLPYPHVAFLARKGETADS